MMVEILVLFFAGWGAGVVTGLIGASAVVFMAPIMVVYLGYGSYEAIGASLATDVFASATSTYVYLRAGNIRVGQGLLIACATVTGAVIGSWASSFLPQASLATLLFTSSPLRAYWSVVLRKTWT